MKKAVNTNRALFELAEGQQGLFTAQQAEEIGFIRSNHSYHVKAGNWVREERGIYRLDQFPYTPEQQLVTYALWSKNRDGEIQGVYSHETALAYYNLTDINPKKLHMTVPKTFRRNSESPRILVLHHNNLANEDVQLAQGFSVTKPLRTIQDIIEIGNISLEFVDQAIVQSLSSGLVRKKQLMEVISKLKIDAPIRRHLEQTIKKVHS
jgi:predicted transcriptional regulator of viral defense system